jgi:hypothetical protein
LRDVHDDESGGRSTIIIKDLDESGSIEALPARSTGSMDPRVRARRIAVRRAKGRKRLIWVAIAAAILVVLVGAIAVLASSLFDVRSVDVQGAVYTDPAQLSEIVDGLKGDAILLEARILAVADVIEGMTHRRPHRDALGMDAAVAEIAGGRGTRYDPAVVDACIALIEEKRFSFAAGIEHAMVPTVPTGPTPI